MTDFAVGATFDIKFTTRQATGAPTTLAGTPAVSAYEDNNTTEITAGITLSVDFDSRTGLNNVRVVATGGNGYSAGKSYFLVITAGTVNSVSVVGEVIGEFTLEREAAFVRLGAPAGASVSADVAAIQADTDNIQTRIPAALVSGRIDASVGAMAANVITATAINADAITAAKVADGTIDAATFAAGAINAAAIAADAIGASELAADAVAEIAAAVGAGGAPTAAQVADAVWDELASDHVGAGSMGQKLNAAGGAADPLTNQVPGSYGAGTAGAALGRIGTGGVTVTVASPVAVDGTITIVRGDDYFAADGVPIDFAFTALPYSFTNAISVKLTLKHRTSGQIVTFTGAVLSASSLRFQPTSAETSVLVANPNSGLGPNAYTYDVEVKLANGHTVTPQIGKANVREGIS